MARKISFSERFPLAGIFLVIAVAIAIPLTTWSLNNVSTQTQQFAAQGGNGKGHNKNVTPTPTPTAITTPTLTPTPAPGITCTSLGGSCYNTFACPLGTSVIQSTTPLCGIPGTNNYGGICCR